MSEITAGEFAPVTVRSRTPMWGGFIPKIKSRAEREALSVAAETRAEEAQKAELALIAKLTDRVKVNNDGKGFQGFTPEFHNAESNSGALYGFVDGYVHALLAALPTPHAKLEAITAMKHNVGQLVEDVSVALNGLSIADESDTATQSERALDAFAFSSPSQIIADKLGTLETEARALLAVSKSADIRDARAKGLTPTHVGFRIAGTGFLALVAIAAFVAPEQRNTAPAFTAAPAQTEIDTRGMTRAHPLAPRTLAERLPDSVTVDGNATFVTRGNATIIHGDTGSRISGTITFPRRHRGPEIPGVPMDADNGSVPPAEEVTK